MKYTTLVYIFHFISLSILFTSVVLNFSQHKHMWLHSFIN